MMDERTSTPIDVRRHSTCPEVRHVHESIETARDNDGWVYLGVYRGVAWFDWETNPAQGLDA